MFIHRLSLEWGITKQTSTGFSLKWSISKRSSIGLSLKWSMKDSLWNVKELDINKALSGMEQYHVNRNLYIARWRNWRLDGAIFRSMERQQNEKRTLCYPRNGACTGMRHIYNGTIIRLSLEWGMSKQNSTGLSLEQSMSKGSSIGFSLKWSMKGNI